MTRTSGCKQQKMKKELAFKGSHRRPRFSFIISSLLSLLVLHTVSRPNQPHPTPSSHVERRLAAEQLVGGGDKQAGRLGIQYGVIAGVADLADEEDLYKDGMVCFMFVCVCVFVCRGWSDPALSLPCPLRTPKTRPREVGDLTHRELIYPSHPPTLRPSTRSTRASTFTSVPTVTGLLFRARWGLVGWSVGQASG